MPDLLIISSSSAARRSGGLMLDVKFVEGMKLYTAQWQGRVACRLIETAADVPFTKVYDPAALPFDISLAAPEDMVSAAEIEGFDVVLSDGDDNKYLHLAGLGGGARIVYTIEYILQSRLQIIFLNKARSLARKMYDVAWTLKQEWRRRRAFRASAGLQANAYPAYEAYAALNPNPLLYLDNRSAEALLATEEEMATRARRLTEGGRVRLLHSGRLEALKGSQDLAPIARRLAEAGLDFELNIFGAGGLEPEIRAAIDEAGLGDRVILHGPVDYETELVPFAREHADIYLSCHRQSDPSCTYLESMGCGLPVAGYDNRMWRAMRDASGAGWTAPLGDWRALADEVIRVARAPGEIAEHAARARAFAGAHAFETEFRRRIDHLKAVAAEG